MPREPKALPLEILLKKLESRMKIIGRIVAVILGAGIYEVVADKITFPLLWGNVLIIALISISDLICDYRKDKNTKK